MGEMVYEEKGWELYLDEFVCVGVCVCVYIRLLQVCAEGS